MEAGSRSRRRLPVKPLEQDRKLLALTPDECQPRSVNPEPMPAILIAESGGDLVPVRLGRSHHRTAIPACSVWLPQPGCPC